VLCCSVPVSRPSLAKARATGRLAGVVFRGHRQSPLLKKRAGEGEREDRQHKNGPENLRIWGPRWARVFLTPGWRSEERGGEPMGEKGGFAARLGARQPGVRLKSGGGSECGQIGEGTASQEREA